MAEATRRRVPRAAVAGAPLIAAKAFGPRLSADGVAGALERGLRAGGLPESDTLLLEVEPAGRRQLRSPSGEELARRLQQLGFDARMRAARAVVLAERRLDERTLQHSAAFEIATRARQAGVPCYAVAGENRLNAFDARMLDLQLVIEAASVGSLRAAGARLAQLLR